jgi:NADH-quinone oxidoreductase subunit N
LMFHAFLPEAHFWAPIFGILCVFTMFMGNLVALQQRQVVRLFAYSSIAQAGYMLLPFALAGYSASVDKAAFSAVVLYIMVYAITNLGAFAIIVGMSRDAPTLLVSDFAGLGQRAAPIAIAMATCLVSLAGIPPTAGFWGKFFIFVAAIQRGDVGVWLAAAMVINSVISLVYYLGIVRSMWLDPIAEPVRPLRIPPSVAFVAAAAAFGVLAVGIYPQLFAHFPPFTAVLRP